MSRVPHPPPRPPSTPSSPARSRLTSSTPSKWRSQSAARAKTPTKSVATATPQEPSAPLSIKEAIALRRAEAKKAQAKGNNSGSHDFISLDDPSLSSTTKPEEEDILGRWPVRETIERARSTGSLNLASRSLPCLPSTLFEIHLGITPDTLKSVPNEPVLPPSSSDAPRRDGKRDAPAWFEAQDLQILKAWNNDITEIQHEISLFGSLKTVDLHNNKLTSLPATFGDLTALTSLDLSHNALTSLPINLFALPDLATLNISHNCLVSIPFNAPFVSGNGAKRNQSTAGSFFTPTITRATTPLPRLITLDASHNKITSVAIDLGIPAGLTKLDLSDNPLGINEPRSQALLQKLGTLQRLKELRFENAELGDDAFPPTLFSFAPFSGLRVLDLGQTKVTIDAAKTALKGMKQEVTYDVTTDDPPLGITCVIIGKKVVKEAWELELERRQQSRIMKPTSSGDWETQTQTKGKPIASASAPSTDPVKKAQREVLKEEWEIEAEQGLLTEGGKRRARAAAAAAAASSPAKAQVNLGNGTPSTSSPGHSPERTSGFLLGKYYSEQTQTLELPESSPPTKARAAHARTFSLAPTSSSSSLTAAQPRHTDLAAPAPTLPLSVIVSQPFADALRVLVLKGRRMDKTFSLPFAVDGQERFLPKLEELDLSNCGLSDVVNVTRSTSDSPSGSMIPTRSSEAILPLIAKMFPSLRALTLSENFLTSVSLTFEALSALILATGEKRGLKHLRLNGNRIDGLEGFQELASLFKGNREVPGWKLDELDVSDNDIGRLPPELGLLPLDEFLVERNSFRVPQDKVWKREGTKGLLSWLRGRIA